MSIKPHILHFLHNSSMCAEVVGSDVLRSLDRPDVEYVILQEQWPSHDPCAFYSAFLYVWQLGSDPFVCRTLCHRGTSGICWFLRLWRGTRVRWRSSFVHASAVPCWQMQQERCHPHTAEVTRCLRQYLTHLCGGWIGATNQVGVISENWLVGHATT